MTERPPQKHRRPSRKVSFGFAVLMVALAAVEASHQRHGRAVSWLGLAVLQVYWGTRPDAYYEWLHGRSSAERSKAAGVVGAALVASFVLGGVFRALPWLAMAGVLAVAHMAFERDRSAQLVPGTEVGQA